MPVSAIMGTNAITATCLIAFHFPDWIVPTLIGVAASFWFGMKFRSKSRMAYQSHDFTIVGEPSAPSIGDIKILFNGVPVPRVVITQFALWNSGNTVVKGSDIVGSDPLKVCFEDGAVILDAQRVNATREVNDFRIRICETNVSSAFLEFDYLNARDGAKFQIIHTGERGKLKVSGSLRGIPNGVENWGDLQEWGEQKSRIGSLKPMAMIVGFLLALTWVKNLIAPKYPAVDRYTEWFGTAVGLLGMFLFVFLLLFITAYSLRAQARSTPKSLSRR